ncbi:FACT complex subunit SSRP1 [Sciurus carolinensis]|uniref:FACT complex subunit SSRP1 n=1 Tax=Sciurus carolinensis TaxID=30640 RepID=A0AA41STT4_SCICA|nr:FACT complex subunit SSRP1 [Sciurus carolinensis]
MNPSYDEYAGSDEDQHDAYLERMKEEGKAREKNTNDSNDGSGEETPTQGDSDQDEKKWKQLKRAKMVKDRKSHKKPMEMKKGKDPHVPKRTMSACMLWLSASREIQSDHPGVSITDLSQMAGEIWKGMSKEKKEEWNQKAEDARREYERAM